MEKVKILAINTSPRDGRNTYHLMNAVLKGCESVEDKEVEIETINVSDAPEGEFKLCKGCWACVKTGNCVLGEDFITEIYKKIDSADGVIFASPVFFCDVSAQCKAIMDRSLGLIPLGKGKASAAVITCGSVGANSALHTIQGFCNMHGFIDAGWVATYGKTRDKEVGKEVAYNLGRKTVQIAAMTKKAKAEAEVEGNTEFIKDIEHNNHFAYGTHTF